MFNRRLRGAKALGVTTVPPRTLTNPHLSAEWDSDGYLTTHDGVKVMKVPSPRRAGRYQIRVAVRWLNPWQDPGSIPPPYPPMDELTTWMYYSYIEVNGQLLGNEARATANPVRAARGTTQYFAADANLNAGDRVTMGFSHHYSEPIVNNVYLEIRRLGPKVHELTGAAGAPSAADTVLEHEI